MTTLAVPLRPNAEQTNARISITGESFASGDHRPPRFVPRDQIYYWTRKWQDGEKEALRDLESGRSRVFVDLNELAQYLARPAE